MARKRAPGGGRKPKRAVAARSQFTVRMPDGLRAQLEASADKRAGRIAGWNLSQEVLHRLQRSLDKDPQSPPMRALCYIISEMGRRGLEVGRGEPSWHRDPFTFKAFKLAIAKLLDTLAPAGEARAPLSNVDYSDLYGPVKTPERLADFLASRTLKWLFQDPLTSDDFAQLREAVERSPLRGTKWDPTPLINDTEMHEYAISDARRDLQLTPPKERG